MAAEIQLRAAAAPTDPDASLGLRWENTVNSPVTSATDLGAGMTVADTYQLDFTKTGGAVTCDVTCGEGSKNPYGGIGIAVTADGATPNTNIVPGVSIVLSASVATGWQAKVSIGAYMTSTPVITDQLNVGIVEAGEMSTAIRVIAENVGADDGASCSVIPVPGSYWTQSGAGNIVKTILNHPSAARERSAVAGTYTITFANWADGTGDNAGYKTADVLVDGEVCVTTGRFDGSSRYGYGLSSAYGDSDDYLQGLYLVLANDTDDPSSVTITLVVGDGYQYAEVAPDSTGSPGTYQTTALTLTETGQTSGTIRASHGAYFWFRWDVPDVATPGDIRLFRLRTRCLSV